ncbi:SARP family transcriptional regulator [Catellatospora sp. TT07R-123]|uniref:AfsR/SARP family transcriptional regulator n=1 Tax=Catellatospora sp. TT07R-123 TaxID=2733863 RepID=UPI001B2F23A3|nr:tetratricopeptide repeat protein [Catellatospora sp. TT07R-123]GHJ48897.1 SARP family transcriptional regulator [Catellatospora sp. TT07R-123]
MRVGLLGPVTAWHDGRALALGPAMQRAVLALLALEPGRVVSVERLVDGLWDEEHPQRPAGVIQTYVSRLRALLRPIGAGIELHGTGYRLDVPPGQVDLHAFRAAVAAALPGDDPAPLRAALALWRGDPLAGLRSTPLLDRLRSGLAEERLAAREECLDRELRVGRHQQVVAELSALHEEQPLRERPLALLLLALYRDGQRPLALDRYARVRRRLAEELGLDPSPELAELHTRLLRDDPGLTAAAEPVLPVPRQLPHDVADFTGRDREVELLVAAARQDGAAVVVCAIDGMAGVGKTALAVHVGHRLADWFPDGQLFLDLHGFTDGHVPMEAGEALGVLLRALGTADAALPEGAAERAGLWRGLLARRRMLVLLDNAATAEQIRPLLPGTAGSLALVTTRRRLAGLDGARSVSLEVLDEPQGRRLFNGVVGARAHAEPAAVGEVLALCGHLPLAIRIAAARLHHRSQWSVGHLAARLRAEQRRLAELRSGDNDVEAAFRLSYRDLTRLEQRLLRLVGTYPGHDVTAASAAALLGADPVRTDELLEALLDAHLLLQRTADRYRCHDLVRVFAAELAGPGERAEAGARVRDWHRAAAAAAMDAYVPAEREYRPVIGPAADPVPVFADAAGALAWLDTERANLIALARSGAGVPGYAGDLSRLLFRYLDNRGHYGDAQFLHGLAAADPDAAVRASAYGSLGNMALRRGHYPVALDHYERALGLVRSAGDRASESRLLNNVGIVLSWTGQPDAAIGHHERGRELAGQVGDRLTEARSLGNLGTVYKMLGRHLAATAAHEQALPIFEELGATGSLALTLFNLGGLGIDLEHYDKALAYLRRALPMAVELGDRSLEANVLDAGGRALACLGDPDGAVGHHERALAISREIGNRPDEHRVLNSLGETLTAAGRPEAALPVHDQARELAGAVGEPSGVARADEGAGRALLALGDRAGAEQLLRAALDGFRELGLPQADRIELLLKEAD